MPASYPVTVYFYTGFNTGNVPAEASILENAQHRDYDAVFKFQSRDNATIRLNAEWAEIKDADYLKLSVAGDLPVYYVVNQVVMLSAKTAEMRLTMDPLLSCGGLSAISVVDGWESRAHVGVSEDGLFENILPEPWTPMNQLRIVDEPETIHDSLGEIEEFIITGSTTDLSQIESYAARVFSSSTGVDVAVPELPALALNKNSDVTFDGRKFTLPSVGLYAIKKYNAPQTSIPEWMSIARSIGVDSALTGSYVLKESDIIVYYRTDSGITTDPTVGNVNDTVDIAGKNTQYTIASNYQYATVKNKKALALYNMYNVTSASSGSTMEFKASEIYISNKQGPVFVVMIDPSPNGTAYCKPLVYEGQSTPKTQQSVAGLPWLNSGLIMSGASGGAITIANAGRANRLVNHNAFISTSKNILEENQLAAESTVSLVKAGAGTLASGLTGDIGGTVSGIADMATAGVARQTGMARLAIEGSDITYQAEYKMGDNLFTSQVSANVTAPEILFPVSVNNSAYYGNSFIITHIGLSANDLNRFDRFLTMYGYAVDRPLTKAHLQNRTHYNYIKTSEAHFKAPAVSMTMLNQLAEMMNRGVRIWHELPNATAFNDNPAKEGT